FVRTKGAMTDGDGCRNADQRARKTETKRHNDEQKRQNAEFCTCKGAKKYKSGDKMSGGNAKRARARLRVADSDRECVPAPCRAISNRRLRARRGRNHPARAASGRPRPLQNGWAG